MIGAVDVLAHERRKVPAHLTLRALRMQEKIQIVNGDHTRRVGGGNYERALRMHDIGRACQPLDRGPAIPQWRTRVIRPHTQATPTPFKRPASMWSRLASLLRQLMRS